MMKYYEATRKENACSSQQLGIGRCHYSLGPSETGLESVKISTLAGQILTPAEGCS